jgi:DNA-binding protein HU-beta
VNKNDLVASVAQSAGLSKADAARAVEATFAAITNSLMNRSEVRLVGFGTFSVSSRAASEGRNPRTGERIFIPASKQPKFKAGKALKEAVNR